MDWLASQIGQVARMEAGEQFDLFLVFWLPVFFFACGWALWAAIKNPKKED